MLPEQITKLIIKQSVVFDKENIFHSQFDRILNEHLAPIVKAGYVSSYDVTFTRISRDTLKLVDNKAKNLLGIIKQVITASDVDYTPELHNELFFTFQNSLSSYVTMTTEHLKSFGEQSKVSESLMAQSKDDLNFITLKINVQIESFCLEYKKSMKKKNESAPTFQMVNNGTVNNPVMGIDNTVNITTTINQLEQTINQSGLTPEKKEQAKGLLGLLSTVVTGGFKCVTSAAIKELADRLFPT